jgi:hypothetical protein
MLSLVEMVLGEEAGYVYIQHIIQQYEQLDTDWPSFLPFGDNPHDREGGGLVFCSINFGRNDFNFRTI